MASLESQSEIDAATAKQRWDSRYTAATDTPAQPCYALTQYQHLLPPARDAAAQFDLRALDLACGLGGNALLLSQLGFATEAWDISAVAIERLQVRANNLALTLSTQVRDVVQQPPAAASFDVIVVSRFLDRSITSALHDALKPDGILFYQTFTQNARSGPKNPAFLLQDNELLRLFENLRVRAFEDNAGCGQMEHGLRDESLLVAQK